MTIAFKNHLAGQSSPYLAQHVHNPVDWFPWGSEALERALSTDRPILLSVGYSACHWCHRMAHESFEDAHIASLMNKHYVCIKVDREERPDLDTIYMAATQAMNQGRGGWPMTVFLTPEQKPFFAGTYFPPADHHGMPGFPRVLNHLAHLWQHDREGLLQQAHSLTEALKPRPQTDTPQGACDSVACMQGAAARLTENFDAQFGGFGPAPKFPHTTGLRLLLAHNHWADDATTEQIVLQTLYGMATGGMYDLIGGGFSRYSVDTRWHVPHFEKMLYDNALLAEVYAEAYVVSGKQSFARVTRETLDFVLKELRHDEGGFYAALDADSEGVEGKFYVWTPAQVDAALKGMSHAAITSICALLNVTEAGNWEDGVSIPRAELNIEQIAGRLAVPTAQLDAWWHEARPRLYACRAQRIWPSLDNKILTAWNGLMLSGLAAGARALNEPKYLAAAERAAEFLYATMRRKDGKLWRSFGGTQPVLHAYLEDYAYVACGLVDVYEAGGDARWLQWAEELGDMLLTEFCDPQTGVFLDTAHDHEALLWRSREGHDGATPNAHAKATHVLARLAVHTRRHAFHAAAEKAVSVYADAMQKSPHAYASLVLAAEVMRRGATEYVFVQPPQDEAQAPDTSAALLAAVRAHYDPCGVWAHGAPAASASSEVLPLLQHKTLTKGQASVYVCRDHTCSPPMTTLEAWHAHRDALSTD